ncbi:hypothetical protein ACFUJY_23655 [Streptomyces sp. NPDC057249]|uniref:hypothetical protein n=1 Tax=Streptomyces sp. NPDC057249 TaxID=3346067 RepID=UPI00362D4368
MTAPVGGIVEAGAVGQSVATALVAAASPGRLLVGSRQDHQARGLVADLQDLAVTSRPRSQVGAGAAAPTCPAATPW